MPPAEGPDGAPLPPPPESLGLRLREGRRRLGWTQAQLADRLGVSQAAVSQFERGQARALSRETARAACELVGVEPPEDPRPAPAAGDVLKYCEHASCVANVRYRGPRGWVVRPSVVRAPAGVLTYCPECGDVLMDHCPNEQCGEPVREGAFCTACGTAYVRHRESAGEPLDRESILARTRPRILRRA